MYKVSKKQSFIQSLIPWDMLYIYMYTHIKQTNKNKTPGQQFHLHEGRQVFHTNFGNISDVQNKYVGWRVNLMKTVSEIYCKIDGLSVAVTE